MARWKRTEATGASAAAAYARIGITYSMLWTQATDAHEHGAECAEGGRAGERCRQSPRGWWAALHGSAYRGWWRGVKGDSVQRRGGKRRLSGRFAPSALRGDRAATCALGFCREP